MMLDSMLSSESCTSLGCSSLKDWVFYLPSAVARHGGLSVALDVFLEYHIMHQCLHIHLSIRSDFLDLG